MIDWLLISIVLLAVSGMPSLLGSRRSDSAQWISTAIGVAGAAIGLLTTIGWLWAGDPLTPEEIKWRWSIVGGEDTQFHLALDGLTALFLIPIYLVAGLGSIYGQGYWRQSDYPENGRKLRMFYGLAAAGMALVVLSRNAVLFLMGWEVMALSAYFLVTTEDHDAQVREVGWVYLVATHLATLLLIALFGLLRGVTGTFEFAEALPPNVLGSSWLCTSIFLLALVGFGLKAGIMPLHVWLPGAHAMAPSHVSALMSGVIIKMGVYGLFRIFSLFPDPPLWWGAIVLLLGVVSASVGIAYAIGQHDLKRLLAYSSIENIGVIFLGLGLALIGQSLDQPDWIVLGMGGALLHVLNHSLFKSLLFFGSGSIVHATHTRRMDLLGGLAHSMPMTARLTLLGIVSAAALPPLNAFVSELMIYIGLFRTLGFDGNSADWRWAALAIPILAMVGAMVVACYVSFYGTVFLGVPRSDHGRHAHEAPPSMLAAMSVQGALCLAVGVAPVLVASWLDRAAAAWIGLPAKNLHAVATLAPLDWLTSINIGLVILVAVGYVLIRAQMTSRGTERTVTWGCGYVAPTSRMQYTASSLGDWVVGFFTWAIRPTRHEPHLKTLFPHGARFAVEVRDVVLDDAAVPASRRLAERLTWFRWMQQGSVQAYLMYILVITVILFFWQ